MQQTQPVQVAETGFLLRRLGNDCPPMQEYRELTQNAIEAIQRVQELDRRAGRPITKGEILWTVDWGRVAIDRVYKLCIVDNGVGMSPEELNEYIGKLSSSGGIQGLYNNFGLGAKISAGLRNPAGVVYESWKDANRPGARVIFWQDPSSDNLFGLRLFDGPGGKQQFWQPLSPITEEAAATDPGLAKIRVAGHGTRVILLGDHDQATTASRPAGAPPYANRWLGFYLNSRYFVMPPDIKLRVLEFKKENQKDWPTKATASTSVGSENRKLDGHKAALDANSEACGQVPLSDAVAHWWLLDPARAQRGGQSNLWIHKGHVAALFQNELYETYPYLGGGRHKLRQFGIEWGATLVVIYVEPSSDNYIPRSARDGLTKVDANSADGVGHLPWERWAEEFGRQIPTAIEAMMERARNAQGGSSRLRDRLKSLQDLFNIPRYRPSRGGKHRTDVDTGISPQNVGGTTSSSSDSSAAGQSKSGSSAGDSSRNDGAGAGWTPTPDSVQVGREDKEDGAVRARPVNTRIEDPLISWLDEQTAQTMGLKPDRVAMYDPPSPHVPGGQIWGNKEWRGFKPVIERVAKEYPDAQREVILEALLNWAGYNLQEAVKAFRSQQITAIPNHWTKEDIEAGLSQEALVMVAGVRSFVYYETKKFVGSHYNRQAKNTAPASENTATGSGADTGTPETGAA